MSGEFEDRVEARLDEWLLAYEREGVKQASPLMDQVMAEKAVAEEMAAERSLRARSELERRQTVLGATPRTGSREVFEGVQRDAPAHTESMNRVLDEVCGRALGQRGDRPTREIAVMVLDRLSELGYGIVMPPRRRPWLDTYLTESRLVDGENQIPGEEGSGA